MTRQAASRVRSGLDLFVTLASGIAAVLLIWRLLSGATAPAAPSSRSTLPIEDITSADIVVNVEGAHSLGLNTAPLVLMEFSDFECPFCAKFARETFPQVEREFVRTGRAQYVTKHFPLEQLHPSALMAAQTAECAARQGRFWDMRKTLFSIQTKLDQADWARIASELDLDFKSFDQCVRAEPASGIDADRAEGRRLGVQSTPTFLIGQRDSVGEVKLLRRVRGAVPFETMRDTLKRLLMNSNSGA